MIRVYLVTSKEDRDQILAAGFDDRAGEIVAFQDGSGLRVSKESVGRIFGVENGAVIAVDIPGELIGEVLAAEIVDGSRGPGLRRRFSFKADWLSRNAQVHAIEVDDERPAAVLPAARGLAESESG